MLRPTLADAPIELAAGRAEAPHWLRSEPVRNDWFRVAALLRARAGSGALVPEPCRNLLAMPGKCLRSTLLLISARFGSGCSLDVPRLAAAIELLHLATLFHDDVIDDAPVRRGLTAPAHRWGSAAAVYGGGYLLSEAMAEFAAAGQRVGILAADAIERLWRGEMEELLSLDDLGLPIRRHLRIVRHKTGALFELPCTIGAELAGVGAPCARALRRFGVRIGVAYQLLDDLRDLLAGSAATGKLHGIDVREGVCTLALLHSARSGAAQVERLKYLLDAEARPTALAELRAMLWSTGSIAFACAVAANCLRSAQAEALRLPPGDARACLLALASALGAELDELR